MMPQKVVGVGMSGGVDSSVAAALLKNLGYQVFGVMLRLWSYDKEGISNTCCSPLDVNKARHIAAQIGIPFYVIDAKEIFKKVVVDSFISGNRKGITPNPCYICNKEIRWKVLLQNVKDLGGNYLATGHYAKLIKGEIGEIELHRAIDKEKDQSYVVSGLTKEQLQQTIFPLGMYNKNEVRNIAREMKMAVSESPESQDLCFLGGLKQEEFINKFAPELFIQGDIALKDGTVVGRHNGLVNYTLGQRKGIRIAGKKPFYVIKKDIPNNRLIIGEVLESASQKFIVDDMNWLIKQVDFSFTADIQTRYHGILMKGKIEQQEKLSKIKIKLKQPIRHITQGQIAVIYDDDRVIGSGIISEIME